jgi:hypothetical protein
MWGFMRTLLRLEVVAYELMRRRRFSRAVTVVCAGMILAACGGDD